MSLARRVWVAWLRIEFRLMALFLPVIVSMLSVAVFIVLGMWWASWVLVPPAAWLGWRAWPLASQIG